MRRCPSNFQTIPRPLCHSLLAKVAICSLFICFLFQALQIGSVVLSSDGTIVSDFGWGDVRLDSLIGMSNTEVKYVHAKELCMEGSDSWKSWSSGQSCVC